MNRRSTAKMVPALVSLLSVARAEAAFHDSFDTVALGPQEDGFGWGSALATPGVGTPPAVVTGSPCSGGCLKFEFNGAYDLASTAYCEMVLNDLTGSQEVWISWMQYFPTSWQHRASTSTDDNEFFKLVFADARTQLRFVFDLATTPSPEPGEPPVTRETLDAVVSVASKDGTGGTQVTALGHGSGSGAGVSFATAMKGRWLNVGVHVKLATSASARNGVIDLSLDGARVVSLAGVDLFAAGGNSIQQVRFMGFANSGFDNPSETYVDNVQVSRQPPSRRPKTPVLTL